METKKVFNSIISFFTIVVIGVTTLWVLSFILPPQDENKMGEIKQEIKDQIKQEIKNEEKKQDSSKYPDYDLLISFKSLTVATNIKSYAIKNSGIVGRIKKTLYSKGTLSRMYIFFEASVDDGKPLSIYDDIYLAFNYQGGHLLPTDSLPTPPGGISRLLYSAEILPARNLEDKSQIKYIDVLNIFNDNQQTGIDVFLSTAREGGLIKNFIIFFECENNSDCEVSDKKL
jgi:hypothetical protein